MCPPYRINMLLIKNTDIHYGLIAIILHWVTALLIIGLIGLGIYMVRLPDVGFNTKKVTLVLWHKELGIWVLLLVVLRLFWRWLNVVPELPPTVPRWQKLAARSVQLAFYGFMFAMPITGWLMSSAAGIPVFFLGWKLPYIISYDDYLFHVYLNVHKWVGYSLAVVICLHIAGALQHHFIYKDDTLRKMLP